MTTLRVDADGVEIAVTVTGEGPDVVVVHGFTGSGDAMAPVVEPLSADHRVIAVDLVGHGASDAPADLESYRTDAVVRQLHQVVTTVAVEPVAMVGYSFGARMALSYACAHPSSVRALALIGATAGIDDPADAAARRRADESLADDIEAHGVIAFVDRWEELPIFATQRSLPTEVQDRIRAGRLANDPRGLANSLRGAGTGHMPPLWDRLGALLMPVTLVVGGLDAKYLDLGNRLVSGLPEAQLYVVDSVGHAAHLEAPDHCARVLREALA